MAVTNRTRFNGWQWDKRNRIWMQTIGPCGKADAQSWLNLVTRGARRNALWDSAYCILPVKEGGPGLSPQEQVALEVEGMELEIIEQPADQPPADASATPADDAPADDAAPDTLAYDGYAKQVTDARDAISHMLDHSAHLHTSLRTLVTAPDSQGPYLDPMSAGDVEVEVDNALRGLRNAYRILSDLHDRVTDARS